MAGIFVRDYLCRRAQPASFTHPSLRTRSIFGSPEEENWCSLSVGLWNLSICQSNASTSTWSTRQSSHKTTFLLVEPDIHRAVIVCRTTHSVVLGRDVLDLLRDDLVQYPGTAFFYAGVYLSVKEKLPGFRVRAGSPCNHITEVLRDTVRTRKNVRMERISVEIHDLQDQLVLTNCLSRFENGGGAHVSFELRAAGCTGKV
jgi:hypothetical protein